MDLLLRISAFLASLRITQSKIIKAIQALNIQPSSNLEFKDRRAVRVAAVQYEMKNYTSLQEYVADINSYVQQAVKNGAQMVVFPEGMGFSSLSLVPFYKKVENQLKSAQDKSQALESVSDVFVDYLYEVYSTLFSHLALSHRIYISAGSTYLYQDDALHNRAHLFGPAGGELAVQDKLFPSGEELAIGMAGGETIEVTETNLGHLAMMVGRDDEYYEPFKIAALFGADIIALSASCKGKKDPLRAVGAVAARAYEYNVFCIRSTMVGRFITGEKLSDQAGIYGPYQCAREEHGVIAAATNDATGCVVSARLDFQRLEGTLDNYNSYSNDSISAQYGGLFRGCE